MEMQFFKVLLRLSYVAFVLGIVYEGVACVYMLATRQYLACIDRALTTGFIAAGLVALACAKYLLEARVTKLEQTERPEQS